MKTILYSTTLELPLGDIRDGYYMVDGVRPELEDGVIELPVIEPTTQPSYDSSIERLSMGDYYIDFTDAENPVWTREWQVVALTQQELNEIDWPHQDYAKRIKVSMADIGIIESLQQFVSQLILWWNLTKLDHEVTLEHAYFYCNFIIPEHQSIVDAFADYITIEDKP